MKIINLSIRGLMLTSLILISCRDETATTFYDYDKVTRLMITQSNNIELSSTDTSSVYLGYLTDFSTDDYKNLDSVKLVVIGGCNYTQDRSYNVSLFDMTNNKLISDSKVSIGIDECNVTKYSGNIRKKFPDQRIDIGIMVSGSQVGRFGDHTFTCTGIRDVELN